MRIVIDLDGTICSLRQAHEAYRDVRPLPGAVEKIRALKKAGHYIIIYTARHMKTCEGDVEQVKAKVGHDTEAWLKKHRVEFDELHYGKPYGHVYLDDLGQAFAGWDQVDPAAFDREMVNVLIPMAGLGSRFKAEGYTGPKPLIDVLGRPMVEHAMRSFDFLDRVTRYRLIFVIRKEEEESHGLGTKLIKLFSAAHPTEIVTIDKPTTGQAVTCLAAEDQINNFHKLFIYNCDTYSTAALWDEIVENDPDGALTYFQASDPRYSYLSIDQHGNVLETAEKRVISTNASTGMYYFKHGRDFVRGAQRMVATGVVSGNEYYVAPVYNELIKLGKKVRAVPADVYRVMGTPEELEQYIANHPSTP